eukprot:TRINITY_DN18301_c0_g3_i1.p1 TRINITY_DN18301_c0_g3~~TRINITY_DN18301_c0_g3_i1.p1  ORF type:complete len:822 (+),score=220.65 TRINITY_DN18301_c0_g3_i1:236-2467(+)
MQSVASLSRKSIAVLDEQVPVRKKARVKTVGLNDELAMIDFIMSDKTGTLTKNKMELKACFVDGVEFVNGNLFPELLEQEKAKHQVAGDGVAVGSLQSLAQAFMIETLHEDALQVDGRLVQGSLSKDPEMHLFQDFLLCVLLCNDVIVTPNVSNPGYGKYVYQSLSPDEVAFVEALNAHDITLTSSTEQKKEFKIHGVNVNTSRLKFTVHGLLGFTADRKRMSVVVEDPKGRYKLFTKGADSKIATLLGETSQNRNLLAITNQYLNYFASDGNRTLVFASKTLTPEEFKDWQTNFQEASISLENREQRLEASFGVIEKDMSLLGCTAVEDPLQDGVPDAIDSLLHAKIVIVVLTGDKQETAVAISRAANIIQPDAHLHFINTIRSTEIGNQLGALLADIKQKGGNHALVIHGDSLEIAIKRKKEEFLAVLPLLQTVVCSRATPSQKAGMVTLVKTELKKVCLAIGDGANDVSMIQKADVGVGLTGKEGSQAAQNADFVLHRFKHLPRLLFVHGRYSYLRVCKVVYWYFYKNILFPFPLIFFGFFSDFSDVSFYDTIILTLFNTAFTQLPPFLIGWTEKDVPEEKLMKNPSLFTWFRDTQEFSIWVFISWVAFGIFQSIIIFWAAYGVFYDVEIISPDGRQAGLYVFGQWIAISVIIVVNMTYLIETVNWTRAFIAGAFLGPIAYLFGFVVYGNSLTLDPQSYGINTYLFGNGMSYLYQLVVTALCLLPMHLRNHVRARETKSV